MLLDRLGARLGEQRGQLVGCERARPRGPSRSRRTRARGGSAPAARSPGAPARDEAPVLDLDRVEHTLRDPLGVDVARVDAQALGQRDAVAPAALAHLMGRGERVLGRDVVAVGATARRGRWRRRPRARPTSPRGSAGSGCPRRASAGASRRSAASCPRSTPGSPSRGSGRLGRPSALRPSASTARAAASAISAGSSP